MNSYRPHAYLGKANSYLSQKDINNSKKYIQLAEKLIVDNKIIFLKPDLYFTKAKVELFVENYVKALEEVTKAASSVEVLGFKPLQVKVKLLHSHILMKLNRPEESKKKLGEAELIQQIMMQDINDDGLKSLIKNLTPEITMK